MKNKKLIIQIIIPLLIGGLVGIITKTFMDYQDLIKPPLAPPSILFPIIWTILYIIMGISAYIISKKDRVPTIYYWQLFINALWSIIFFVFKWRFIAFLWIIILIISIIKMIKEFKKISPKAAYLQIPYLLWTIFAAYLNLGIYLLN